MNNNTEIVDGEKRNQAFALIASTVKKMNEIWWRFDPDPGEMFQARINNAYLKNDFDSIPSILSEWEKYCFSRVEKYIAGLRVTTEGISEKVNKRISSRISEFLADKNRLSKEKSIQIAYTEIIALMPEGIADCATEWTAKMMDWNPDKRLRFWRMAAGYCRKDRGFGVEVEGLSIREALEKTFLELSGTGKK